MTDNDKCLVLFSGGQDSSTCLAWAVQNFTKTETIGFDYGQRHSIELGNKYDEMQRGIDWFIKFNPKAYMVLLD